MDKSITAANSEKEGIKDSLILSMYLLLMIHTLQVIFLRKLYTPDHKVNTKHWWVWIVHLVVFPYIIFK